MGASPAIAGVCWVCIPEGWRCRAFGPQDSCVVCALGTSPAGQTSANKYNHNEQNWNRVL